jgi:hypothetical protein
MIKTQVQEVMFDRTKLCQSSTSLSVSPLSLIKHKPCDLHHILHHPHQCLFNNARENNHLFFPSLPIMYALSFINAKFKSNLRGWTWLSFQSHHNLHSWFLPNGHGSCVAISLGGTLVWMSSKRLLHL